MSERPSLAAIYAANEYPARVDGAWVVLRPGTPCPALDAAIEARGLAGDAAHAAYLTAFDPHGEPRERAANLEAQAQLEGLLRGRFEIVEAPGGWPAGVADPEGHREPSLLVLGVPRGEAVALGRAFGQAAIVVHARGASSELVMLE